MRFSFQKSPNANPEKKGVKVESNSSPNLATAFEDGICVDGGMAIGLVNSHNEKADIATRSVKSPIATPRSKFIRVLHIMKLALKEKKKNIAMFSFASCLAGMTGKSALDEMNERAPKDAYVELRREREKALLESTKRYQRALKAYKEHCDAIGRPELFSQRWEPGPGEGIYCSSLCLV